MQKFVSPRCSPLNELSVSVRTSDLNKLDMAKIDEPISGEQKCISINYFANPFYSFIMTCKLCNVISRVMIMDRQGA